jgi:hypothetical protein
MRNQWTGEQANFWIKETAVSPKLARQIINCVLESKKIWDYRERETHDNEQNCIGYEVRKGHQPDAAKQGNKTLLPLSKNKVGQTDRAKNYPPDQ